MSSLLDREKKGHLLYRVLPHQQDLESTTDPWFWPLSGLQGTKRPQNLLPLLGHSCLCQRPSTSSKSSNRQNIVLNSPTENHWKKKLRKKPPIFVIANSFIIVRSVWPVQAKAFEQDYSISRWIHTAWIFLSIISAQYLMVLRMTYEWGEVFFWMPWWWVKVLKYEIQARKNGIIYCPSFQNALNMPNLCTTDLLSPGNLFHNFWSSIFK